MNFPAVGSQKISVVLKNETSAVQGTVTLDGLLWSAAFEPREMGGDYTVIATCDGCVNNTSAVLEHVTFGDVWCVVHRPVEV